MNVNVHKTGDGGVPGSLNFHAAAWELHGIPRPNGFDLAVANEDSCVVDFSKRSNGAPGAEKGDGHG